MKERVFTFAGDEPQFDDITMMSFTYYGRSEESQSEVKTEGKDKKDKSDEGNGKVSFGEITLEEVTPEEIGSGEIKSKEAEAEKIGGGTVSLEEIKDSEQEV